MPLKPKNPLATDDRIIFFITSEDHDRLRKMCKEKTERRRELKEKGVVTKSTEIRRLVLAELKRWDNPPF